MDPLYWFLWYVLISMFGVFAWGLYSGLSKGLVKKGSDTTGKVMARLVLTLLCAGGIAGVFMVLNGTLKIRIN